MDLELERIFDIF
jgi:hypothetical protein